MPENKWNMSLNSKYSLIILIYPEPGYILNTPKNQKWDEAKIM